MSASSISLLVPTVERREVFWPWLAANLRQQIDRLVWRWKQGVEVVVCSDTKSLPRPLEDLPSHVRLIHRTMPTMASIGRKRNALLLAANGEYSAWVDDDDWHDPARFDFLGQLTRPPWLTHTGLEWIHLRHSQVWVASRRPIPQLVVGRTALLRSLPFRDTSIGEDATWLRKLGVLRPDGLILRAERPLLAAVRHAGNTTHTLDQAFLKAYAARQTIPLDLWLDEPGRSPALRGAFSALSTTLRGTAAG